MNGIDTELLPRSAARVISDSICCSTPLNTSEKAVQLACAAIATSSLATCVAALRCINHINVLSGTARLGGSRGHPGTHSGRLARAAGVAMGAGTPSALRRTRGQ